MANMKNKPSTVSLHQHKVERENTSFKDDVTALKERFRHLPDERAKKVVEALEKVEEEFQGFVEKSSLEGGYIMLSVTQTKRVAKALRDLPTAYHPIHSRDLFILAMLSIKSGSTRITATRDELAEEMGIDTQYVTRAFNTLCKLHIFYRERDGHSYRYYLNESVGWRGSLKLHKEALQTKPPKQLEMKLV